MANDPQVTMLIKELHRIGREATRTDERLRRARADASDYTIYSAPFSSEDRRRIRAIHKRLTKLQRRRESNAAEKDVLNKKLRALVLG